MKYIGLIRSGTDTTTRDEFSAGAELERLLPVTNGYVKGYLTNLSSDDIFVNFFLADRESARVIVMAGETIEVVNQPCSRLLVKPLNDLTTTEIEYIFHVVQADNDIENVELLIQSDIKKNNSFTGGGAVARRYVLYPQLSSLAPGVIIGDIFKRTALSLTNYPLLYQSLGTGTAAIQGNSFLSIQLPLTANDAHYVQTQQSAIYNGAVDPLYQIRRVTAVVKCGFGAPESGVQAGCGWNDANIGWDAPTETNPGFGILKNYDETIWRLWISDGQSLADIDTGIEIGQYPIVSAYFIWTASQIEARLLDFDDRILYRFVSPVGFTTSPEQALQLQMYLLRSSFTGVLDFSVYSWSVEIA